MIPKLWENSEIQIICNCEIHDCWVKDCIKKKKKKAGFCIQTNPRRVSECVYARLRLSGERCASLHCHRLGQVSWTVHLESNRRFIYSEIHNREYFCWPHVTDKKTPIINGDVGASDTTRGFSSLGNLDALKMLRVSACDSCVDINVCLSARSAARFGSVQNVSLRGSALKAASTMTKFTDHTSFKAFISTSCNVAKSLRYRSKASKANRVWRDQKREKETITPQP